MWQRLSKLWVFLSVGVILLLLGGGWWFLNSAGYRDARNAKASERFGDALLRAGIKTQAGPSK